MSEVWRHEWKYLIDETTIIHLKQCLSAFMNADKHHTSSRGYTIRSLYFDTIFDTFMDDNEAGIDQRNKYRIRYYGQDQTHLHLEIKRKSHGLCHKISHGLTKQQYDDLIHDHFMAFYDKTIDTTLQHMIMDHQRYHLLPKVIVEYDRYALVYPSGNVRITFDQNIRKVDRPSLFFDPIIPWTMVEPNGMHILEVKYDDLLPSLIKTMLDDFKLTQIAHSKYYLSRIV